MAPERLFLPVYGLRTTMFRISRNVLSKLRREFVSNSIPDDQSYPWQRPQSKVKPSLKNVLFFYRPIQKSFLQGNFPRMRKTLTYTNIGFSVLYKVKKHFFGVFFWGQLKQLILP